MDEWIEGRAEGLERRMDAAERQAHENKGRLDTNDRAFCAMLERISALEDKQPAGNAGGPYVDSALAGAAEDIERALGLAANHGETLPQLVDLVLEELERTRVREGRLIVRVNAMGRVVGETVEELSALVQPTAPWDDVAACSECGDPLDRPTGSEWCSRCAATCYHM